MFIIHNPITYKNVFLFENMHFYVIFGQKYAQKICYKTHILTIHYIFTFFYGKYLHNRKKLFNFVVYFAREIAFV